MIKRGDKIENHRTGQIMIFLKTGAESNGELLQIECMSPPSAVKEPEHIHPFQENKFKIISGSCTFKIDGKERIATEGDLVIIPPMVRHYFWNSGTKDAHYIQEFRPALTIADFFETFFALSRDAKLNEKGIPNFFHASLIMLEHKNDIRIVAPPWPVQLLTYLALYPIGRMMGFRADYKSKN